MNDFKTIAKTGPDFVNIVFENTMDDIDNILVELFIDDMKMNTFVCEGTDTSITIQPLAEGNYHYKVSQISDSRVQVAENNFTIIKNDVSSDNNEEGNTYLILNIYAQILEHKGGWIFTSCSEHPIQIMKGTEICVKGGNLVFTKLEINGFRQSYCIPFHGIQYVRHDP